uniref:A-kinase anchoring protein 5 n=1 Tax=Naja naja TaxID=35670 RepID=A0A8C6VD71_NAJNA
MEHSAKGIQMDTEQRLETSNTTDPIIAPDSPAKKASIFCFKKRKKSCEKSSDMGHNETEVSSPFWTSGEAWLAFKRLVTLRRRSKSSLKKQTQACSRVHLDADIGDSGRTRFPKEHTNSSSKIPCLRLSRSKKRTSHSEIIEQPDCEKKESIYSANILNEKRNGESEIVAMEAPLDTKQSPNKGLQEGESDSGAMTNTENAALSNRENTFPDPNCYIDCGVPSEIIHSETALVTEEEKQIFQLHHGTLYGNTEDLENQKFSFNVEIGPPIPQDLPESEQQLIGREGTKETKSQPFGADTDVVAKTIKQKGKKKTSKNKASSAGCNYTKEDQEGSQVPSSFGTNSQEHWTSEQYEMLLIETAASLVKTAIQSSVEQLVNEMALEQNKQNSVL